MQKIIKVKDNGPRKENEEKELERIKKLTKGGRGNMLRRREGVKMKADDRHKLKNTNNVFSSER
jgi:hypothetical protein